MMAYMDGRSRDIVSKPRGGPDASRLDRRLQTNRLEYLDRDDVDDLKRGHPPPGCPELDGPPRPRKGADATSGP